MVIRYIHELEEWPSFYWEERRLAALLATIRFGQAHLLGQMEALGFDIRRETSFRMLTEEAIKSSQIEGERLDTDVVRSSIARRLGIDIGGLSPVDRSVDGLVDMMLDATQEFADPLTEERLFGWHAALFPTGRSGLRRIRVGDWRDDLSGPMQVVSGPPGREWVHFEAPAADRLPSEMRAFLDWFNEDSGTDPLLKAALSHLWFVTIHPFEDGNGRIARAITDLALARSEGQHQRFYSMSSQIERDRNNYYRELEGAQKADLDVTAWFTWFLNCLGSAIEIAKTSLGTSLGRARFWERLRAFPMNARQREMLNRLFEGFEGNLTTSKWAQITKTSTDTALRDISELVSFGVLKRDDAGGRSTRYWLAEAVTDDASHARSSVDLSS